MILLKHPPLKQVGYFSLPLIEKLGTGCGMVNVYVRGATAAIMIQENWGDSVQRDVITLLRQIVLTIVEA